MLNILGFDILYVVDSLGWVQHKRVKHLQKNGIPFKIFVITGSWFKRLYPLGFFKNKIIYFSTWRMVHDWTKKNPNFFSTKDYSKMIAAVTSHSNIGGGLSVEHSIGPRSETEAMEIAVNTLKKFYLVSVNSKILFELLDPHLSNIYYCPNGVDIDFYSYNKRSLGDKIKIGWVGKVRASKNFELIEQLKLYLEESESFEVDCIKVDKKFQTAPLTDDQMKDFYNSIDFYICTSWNEGTPNPALEAGSCGVPLITTKVGNMREIVRHSETGYFIEPNLDSIKNILSEINRNRPNYEQMSESIRVEIEKNWSWKIRIKNFIEMFNKVKGI